MKLQYMVEILSSRRKLALSIFSSVLLLAIALNLFLPNMWTAESELVLNQQAKDPMTGMPVAAYLVPGFLDTQAEIAGSHNVALKVVDALGLDKFEDTKQAYMDDTGGTGSIRDWLADQLRKKLTVRPGRESSTLTIDYQGDSAKFAALMANSFAQSYLNTVSDMQTSEASQQSQVFQQQLQALQTNLERARQRLEEYQQQTGVMINPDERIDMQAQRLSDLSTAVVGAQSQESDARARMGGGALAPDVEANNLIQQMKSSVALSQAKFETAAAKYGVNHPYYQQALAELNSNRQQLKLLVQQSVDALRHGAEDAAARKDNLQQSLKDEQGNILQHEAQSSRIDVLQKEEEEAQRAYSQALAHFSDSDLASHISQPDVYIVQNAPEPTKATWPRPLLSMAVALVVGVLLSIGGALLAEMLDRRVRTVEDLEIYLDLPVLAHVRSVKEPRRLLPRRLFPGAKPHPGAKLP